MNKLSVIFILIIGVQMHSTAQTERELAMINEINRVRQDPESFIPFVQEFMELIDATSAEQRTANELIRELKSTKPMDTLVFDQELFELAEKHAHWMERKDKFDHSDYPNPENLVGGTEDVRYAVVDLLVDHGIRDRGHRRNLLNPELRKIACAEASGTVDGLPYVFVQIFE